MQALVNFVGLVLPWTESMSQMNGCPGSRPLPGKPWLTYLLQVLEIQSGGDPCPPHTRLGREQDFGHALRGTQYLRRQVLPSRWAPHSARSVWGQRAVCPLSPPWSTGVISQPFLLQGSPELSSSRCSGRHHTPFGTCTPFSSYFSLLPSLPTQTLS